MTGICALDAPQGNGMIEAKPNEQAVFDMEKKEIRALMRRQKQALTEDFVADYSRRVTQRFTALPEYERARVLYAYLTFNEEIRTDGLIRRAWADGKRVAVPRVLGKGVMEFYYIDSFDGFITSAFGVPEPPEDPAKLADERDVLLLMPGLAFDRAHNRVGYGGGFYDRYIERGEAAGTVFFKPALAYPFQIVDGIDAQEHDIRVDAVITADEVF
ncbi:MAG: 5-formyltetrahydrofolate cyclo-ligase [Ruminococcaceae bacterium]|nr:5-formyltetrahydrofolate cyclo-ligase [Oscillospiraceae bacterium]